VMVIADEHPRCNQYVFFHNDLINACDVQSGSGVESIAEMYAGGVPRVPMSVDRLETPKLAESNPLSDLDVSPTD